jgi:putative ABC transport system permease protein
MVPLSTAKRGLLGRSHAQSRAVQAISVKIREGEDLGEAEGQIRDLLRQRHRLQLHQEDDFTLRNLSEVVQSHEEASRVMARLLAAVASVSLLVGGIGIMNIMLASVTERTREIGLRMAIGALEREVLLQFLVEAIVLSAFGGVVGVLLAVATSAGVAATFGLPFVVDWSMMVLAFVFSAGVGIVFGFVPAQRAARLNPIDALRHE